MKAAIYARVSTVDQEPENQLAELRRYVRARSWPDAAEYVDKGVSGSKDRGPALAELERARIAERVAAGLARAKREGKRLGRPRNASLSASWRRSGVFRYERLPGGSACLGQPRTAGRTVRSYPRG